MAGKARVWQLYPLYVHRSRRERGDTLDEVERILIRICTAQSINGDE